MRMRVLVASVAAFLLTSGAAQAAVPTVTTGGANNLTQTTATLHGTVKPNNQATTYHFEYGLTNTYGATTPESGPIPAGAGNQNVTADISGLTPGTTYHYRLVATNAAGAVGGKDRQFTTRPALALNLSRGVVPFGQSVTISGQVFGTSVSGITVTLAENPYPFAGFNQVSTTTTDGGGRYQFIRPVSSNTAYRVTAQTKPAGTSSTGFVYEQDVISLKPSTSRPKRRHSVLFTGFSSPARIGVPVYIQRLGKRGWRTVLKATLAATTVPNSASFAVRLPARKVVSGAYRAYVIGGFDHLAGISSAKHIRVRR
jgi:hypothetical protein